MRYLVNSSQMKAVDNYNINELGIPSLVLMERAALAVAAEAESMTKQGDSILVICGMGNNGADGLAAARMLTLHGRKVRVVLCGTPDRATKEHSVQLNVVKKLGIFIDTMDISQEYSIKGALNASLWGEYDLIIDALFGVGLSRLLEGIYVSLIGVVNQLHETGKAVLAVDIPSGISASDGRVLGAAVKADVTVTFGYEKLGMVFYPGSVYCGRKSVADIGFSMEKDLKVRLARTFEKKDLSFLPERRPDGNKGTFGKVLIAAGSSGMCGAAYMSALAAYRMGAGLVRIYTVKENVMMLQTMLPEAIVTAFDKEYLDKEQLEKAAGWADAAVIGPGLSTEPYAKVILTWFLKLCRCPVVLDADALNLLGMHRELFTYLNSNMVVTPHVGEMKRLTGREIQEIKENPIGIAENFHKTYGAVCVLKDARTVIASGNGVYVNTSGNDGMATGGSGDVLSGIIGGLLAGGMRICDGAELGVYLHGLAGDAAAKKHGKRALMATDILASLGELQKQ